MRSPSFTLLSFQVLDAVGLNLWYKRQKTYLSWFRKRELSRTLATISNIVSWHLIAEEKHSTL
jgi:hypothetical protein